MKVVVFCGGQGTRLREETEYKPKPMVEIGGKPILWHILKGYAAHGFKEFVLCLGYRQAAIRDYFLNYETMNSDFTIRLSSRNEIKYHNNHKEDWTVTLVDTGELTKKGSRLKLVQPYLGQEDFMLTYGDGVANVDVNALLGFHRAHGRIVTFTGVHPISRFATVETNATGDVVDWNEKKKLEGYVNAGYFVLKPGIFDYLNEDCELEEEPLKALAEHNEVRMYRHEGFWQCMDTYRDYVYLNELWQRGAPWKQW